MKKIVGICILLQVLSLFTNGQHPLYYSITNENGLPTNEVYDIDQDQFGYVWIGSDEGLFRFDGNTFLPFVCDKQNGRSISGIEITTIGKLYAHNFNGQVYQLNNDSLAIFSEKKNSNQTNSLYTIDSKNHVWQYDSSGLIEYSADGEIIAQHNFVNSTILGTLTDIIAFENAIYVSDGAGQILKWHVEEHKLIKIFPNDNTPHPVKHQFFPTSSGLLIVTEDLTNHNYIFQSTLNDKLTPFHFTFNLPKSRIYNFREVQKNIYMFCTSDGLFEFTKSNLTGHFLSGQNISSVMRDRDGSLWITTLQNGVHVIPNRANIVYNQENSSLTNDHLTAISAEFDRIWLGAHDGAIFALDVRGNKISQIIKPQNHLSTKAILSTDSQTWIAHGSLSWLRNKTEIDEIPIYNARDFEVQGDSIVYVLPHICGYAPIQSSRSNVYGQTIPIGGRSISFHPIENKYYLALNTGLFVLDHQELKEIKDDDKSIHCTNLHYSDGQVYAATFNNGLYTIKAGQIISHENSTNSTLENELKLVYADEHGIWCCNRNGIFHQAINQRKWVRYSSQLGLLPGDINAITSSSDNLYLATNKGLIILPKKSLSGISSPPYFEITSIQSDLKNYFKSNKIDLPFDHQYLSFRFNAVHLVGRGSHRICYRIIELDSIWKYLPGSANELTFQMLPPGDYTLQLFAESAENNRSQASIINIHVQRPLWQQWWFYVFISIFILTTGFFIIKTRYAILQRKNRDEKRILISEIHSLKARMNPHFMHNALNSIQSLILEQENKKANQYLTKFSRLMRHVLEASGKEFIALQEELDMIAWYLELEQLRFGSDLEVVTTIENSVDISNTMIPSMIIQPFIENALKHGLLHKKGNKKLVIDFSIKDNSLHCVIEDNGIGREKAIQIKLRQNTSDVSFATNSIFERFDLLKRMSGKKYVFTTTDLIINGEAAGTRVTIEIPL